MSIALHVPPSHRTLNLASIVKPLIDGVVAAFHLHDGKCLDEIGSRLATRIGVRRRDVERFLIEGEAILDKRTLVRPFRAGVQWYPGDDAIVVCRVLVDNGPPEDGIAFSGTLYETVPVT
ncbi:hypothetical protein FJY68_14090 [candidate division WOR-3 bacterium]|uniref:Uncharacterized protein n=1 Tax=candidate division WOR-3 bacterium TaxID=2052148 RepID=A0A938BUS0_UNCW3|nr:hypothetical protein [candidate division WOR-3 bacterium]